MPDLPEYLIIEEVAELIRTPVRTLYSWRRTGYGPKSRQLNGRRLLYRRDEVIKWVEDQVRLDAA